MIRFLILAGYFELMLMLQTSGKLNQYINVHYRYLAILSMILSLILAIVQLILWVKNDQTQHEHDDHQHGLKSRSQRIIAYVLLSLPLIVGYLFPTVSLDTTIVEAKGFNFPISKESVGDPEMNTQYLKPDTSIYFNENDYHDQMTKLLAKYQNQSDLKVTEDNYLELMELIYNYPSEFLGRTITYTGFAYVTQQNGTTDDFIFRFGIIHCVADSGVFGLRVTLPANTTVQNNEWVTISGTLTNDYYAPFKRQLPTVKVATLTKVATPANTYVYRSF
ncbi:TIGR03943 family putative permease subunit [Enterococcus nangangensis]|uniref:TIGR03943 family putative permease subunit n=1 Tax=Enterococcus nangangensis TaxID=2559926 RepID=UPI0010F53086|nr:TIGR03943 family protein [Enterococcus nangangensis]